MSKRRSSYIPKDDGKSVLLDYYDGAYGKTLRIDTQSSEGMGRFVSFVEDFCKGTAGQASLRSIEHVVLAPPLADVRLVRSETVSISASESAQGTLIEWSNHQKGWERVLGLLGPLIAFGRDGKSRHQYLTPPDASILVELALLE